MVTGVQIHNWAEEFDGGEPNLEWVAPVNVYAVVNGQRFDVDLSRFPVSGCFLWVSFNYASRHDLGDLACFTAILLSGVCSACLP